MSKWNSVQVAVENVPLGNQSFFGLEPISKKVSQSRVITLLRYKAIWLAVHVLVVQFTLFWLLLKINSRRLHKTNLRQKFTVLK